MDIMDTMDIMDDVRSREGGRANGQMDRWPAKLANMDRAPTGNPTWRPVHRPSGPQSILSIMSIPEPPTVS
jgi:hypothetical protein